MHFSLLGVGPDLEHQLEPFEACEENEDGRFAFYEIGGQWSRMLKLLSGREGECGSEVEGLETPGWVDQARKGDIDFVGIRTTAEQRASAVWRKAREITGGQLWQTCESIFAPVEALKQNDTERYHAVFHGAREAYSDQPAVQKLRDAGYWDQVDLMLLPEDEFVSLNPGLVTFAYLLNGVWHEKAFTWDRTLDRPLHDEFAAMLDSLPDDALLTVVDYHG
jgi:hypothetical protein